jgi:hypothetical protein
MLLAEGTNLLCGLPGEVMASPEVERVYLGVAADKTPKRQRRKFGLVPAEGNSKSDE